MTQEVTLGDASASTAPNSASVDAATHVRMAKRKRLLLILGTFVVVAGAGWTARWIFIESKFESTDNAYVVAEIALIAPRVEGTLETVLVRDTETVKSGQVLATLDRTDAKLTVTQAEADYARAKQHVAQYFAKVGSAKAQIVSRESDLERAQTDYKRRQILAATGAISKDELTSKENALQTSQSNLEAARHELTAQFALVSGTDSDHNPEVLAAKAHLEKAIADLDRTIILAPIDGVVAQNIAQIGQHVGPYSPLMTIIPISKVYVVANYKEGQLEQVHPNQSVTLSSDLYGSDVVFHGHVDGLGAGTGSALAVIPAQNATGNWIKVIQRLPVRIALDQKDLADHPLRVGLSMTAKIRISQ